MFWMNPTGAWALLGLAVILALYILKQRMEPLEVSSTYLWRKAAASLEADRPFQKLRRNLLMFIQLLLALVLALSIMRPMSVGGEAGEVIFVFDLSASMQADGGDGTRLESAIADATRRIDGLPDGARVSVLTAGRQVGQPVARTSDLSTARRAIEGLTPENGMADMDGALSLALALQRELEDVALVVYSDQILPEGQYSQPRVGTGRSNRTILSVMATDTAAVARVVNYGNQADLTVECYADGELVDLRTVSLAPDELVSVQFTLPKPAARVDVRIDEEDALMADNVRTWVSRDSYATTIHLAGRDNIFIEKAIALREDVQLLRTTAEEAATLGGASLTVIDGPISALPEQGALLLLNPDRYVEAVLESPATLEAATGPLADQINEYLQVSEIQVAQWTPVDGGTPIWLADGKPILSILEEDGRTIAILGFDLHSSNLPLLKEFPLFIQGLLSYLVPEPLGADFEGAACGSVLQIKPQALAQSASIETPSGRGVFIPTSGGSFADTNDIGVYTLVQTDFDGVRTDMPFALHIPVSESDVRTVAQVQEEAAASGRGTAYGREWTPWLMLALLAITLLEWWVYRRGI